MYIEINLRIHITKFHIIKYNQKLIELIVK